MATDRASPQPTARSTTPHRMNRIVFCVRNAQRIDAHRDRPYRRGLHQHWADDSILKYPAMERARDQRPIVRLASGFTCTNSTPSTALRFDGLYSPLTWSVLLCAGPIFFLRRALTTWRTSHRKAKASANKPGHRVGASRKIRSPEHAAGI
jgi:hypothetical protein